MISIGDKGPQFSVLDQSSTTVSLEQFKGKKVLLYFYPKDNTSGCTIEATDFTKKKSEFDSKNVVILGVSKDSVKSHANFCKKQNLNITLLSDPDHLILEPYGVWQEKKNYGKTYMGIVRTTFLLDEKGIIKTIWNNVKAKGHVDQVLQELS
jgi:thioredoxin-dependent peroxiredoxin